jgi:hypothetical protein
MEVAVAGGHPWLPLSLLLFCVVVMMVLLMAVPIMVLRLVLCDSCRC